MPRIYKTKPILDPKFCPSCSLTKPLAQFPINKKTYDGKYSNCKECKSKARALVRQLHPDRIKEQKQRSDKKCRARINATVRLWRKKNWPRVYASNSKWRLANPARWTAITRAYNLLRKKAMPPWVNTKELITIYENCPPGYEVDHIYPIKGKNFNGLHVPWNLQYLPMKENRRKGNKLPEEWHKLQATASISN